MLGTLTLVLYASDLRLAPGQWPTALENVQSRRWTFRSYLRNRQDRSIYAAEYVPTETPKAGEHTRLHVLND